MAPLEAPDGSRAYPVEPESLPAATLSEGKFQVRFVRSLPELRAVQRLRFEVFNLELGEGLDESYDSGLDADRFDDWCHHLMVSHAPTGEVVGTYRMQTHSMAEAHGGFYSAGEFKLDALPPQVLGDAVEIGRACVSRDWRNRHVLFLLWKGLAAYLQHNRKRYLFGCCSLTSQDPVEGKQVMEHLLAQGFVHPEFRVDPQPDWRCYDPGFRLSPDQRAAVKLPKLFRLYLRYGARVCGEPAIDRFFKTIDYLVLFDLHDLDGQSRRTFFPS